MIASSLSLYDPPPPRTRTRFSCSWSSTRAGAMSVSEVTSLMTKLLKSRSLSTSGVSWISIEPDLRLGADRELRIGYVCEEAEAEEVAAPVPLEPVAAARRGQARRAARDRPAILLRTGVGLSADVDARLSPLALVKDEGKAERRDVARLERIVEMPRAGHLKEDFFAALIEIEGSGAQIRGCSTPTSRRGRSRPPRHGP